MIWKIIQHVSTTKVVLLSSLMILALGLPQNKATILENTKWGLFMALLILILCEYTMNNRKRNFLYNERFSFVIKIIFLFYMVFLIVLLFNNPKDGLTIVNGMFPSYAKEQPPKFIAKTKSCEFRPIELLRDVDEYFACHLFGWLLMSIFTKDIKIIFLLGVFDETFEFTTREIIPLFGECWFDQIFYDMLITNLSGLFLGYLIISKLGVKKNDLLGGNVLFLTNNTERKMTLWQRIKNLKVFHSSKRLYYCSVLIFFKCANLISTFVLFDALWIPIVSIATVTRLFIWGFCYSEMVHETQVQLDLDQLLLDTKSKNVN